MGELKLENMSFRKLLVKNFVLGYRVNIFGRIYNAPRASRVIMPLVALTGWFQSLNEDYPNPTTLIWILLVLTGLSLFFGFIYFHIVPPKWNELDDYQKYQYGQIRRLPFKYYKEWLTICKKFN